MQSEVRLYREGNSFVDLIQIKNEVQTSYHVRKWLGKESLAHSHHDTLRSAKKAFSTLVQKEMAK